MVCAESLGAAAAKAATLPAVTVNDADRYWIRHESRWPWWSALVFLVLIWAWPLASLAVGRYHPPSGWNAAIVATPLILLFAMFMVWMANTLGTQYVLVRPEGIIIAVPFERLIRLE